MGRYVQSVARRRDAESVGIAGILDRLGHARFESDRKLLRPDQLSPRQCVATIHRMGRAFGISKPSCALWICAPYAECRPHLGTGFGRGHGVALRRIFSMVWSQHIASTVVVGNGGN